MKTTHAGLTLVKSADVPDWQQICHRMDPAPRLNIRKPEGGCWPLLIACLISAALTCLGAYGAWVLICKLIARWM